MLTRRSVLALGGGAALSCAVPVLATEADRAALAPWTGREKEKPAFVLDDLHGQRRSLKDFEGHAVIVHFFATWCEPCVREMTSLRQFAASLRDKRLAIVAIAVAEVDLKVRAFFEKLPVDFPVLLDRDRAVTKAWQVSTLPTSFVLDADLVPRFHVESDLDWTRPDVLAAIAQLVPPTTPTQPPHPAATAKAGTR